MNKFEKVSKKQYVKDTDQNYKNTYDNIVMPQRKTTFSAGYDIHSPIAFTLNPGETIKITTGLKVRIAEGSCLLIIPRSSLGFNYRIQLDNSVGLIDCDYYNNQDNEGHIFVKLTNDSKNGKVLKINPNDAIAQGIFIQFGITSDDNPGGQRVGGIGSTNK